MNISASLYDRNQLNSCLALHDEKTAKGARYYNDEDCLRKYCVNANHSDFEYVYFISTLINSFYSTRMGAEKVFEMAKYIHQNSAMFNNIIQNNDTSCLNKIKKIGNKYYNYTFITKYISIHSRYHSPDNISKFPIYDSRVQAVLANYGFVKKTSNKYRDYSVFYKKMSEIKDEFIKQNISDMNFTKLDNYFWILGEKILNIPGDNSSDKISD